MDTGRNAYLGLYKNDYKYMFIKITTFLIDTGRNVYLGLYENTYKYMLIKTTIFLMDTGWDVIYFLNCNAYLCLSHKNMYNYINWYPPVGSSHSRYLFLRCSSLDGP